MLLLIVSLAVQIVALTSIDHSLNHISSIIQNQLHSSEGNLESDQIALIKDKLARADESFTATRQSASLPLPWLTPVPPASGGFAGLAAALEPAAAGQAGLETFSAQFTEIQGQFQRYHIAFLRHSFNALLTVALVGILACLLCAWLLVIRHRRNVQAARAQRVMINIGQAIAKADSLEELLALIHSELKTLFDARNFFVALYDPTTKHYSFPYFVDELDTDFAPQPLEDGLTDYVRRTGQPLLYDRRLPSLPQELKQVKLFGPHSPSWMGVSLSTSRGLSGVVCVQSYSAQTTYTHDNLTLLDMVAQNIALAVERKQADDALRRSEQNYRSFVEESEDGIWCAVFDPPVPIDLPPAEQIRFALATGWVADCNNAYAMRNGFKNAAALIGQPFSALHSVKVPAKVRVFLDFINNEYRLHEYEAIQLWPDGTELLTSNNITGMVDQGKLSVVWGIQRDITAQRIIERALAESERTYSSLVRNMPGVVFRAANDENLTLEYVSEAIQEITGYSADEFIDEKIRSFSSLMSPEDLPAILDRIWQAVDSHKPYEFTYQITCADGKKKWLRQTGRGVYGDEGEFLSLEGLIFDVTQQVLAEEDQRLLATAIEHAAESVIITNPRGKIQYVNPAFERTSKFSKAEVIGQNSNVLKSGKHNDQFYRQLWETITSGRTWQGRMYSRCADDSLIEEEVAISPVFDAAGRIQHFVAVKRDITKERELQMRIQQAQKMESLAVLAGGIAHDFNNLLMGILGNASLALLEIPSDSEVAVYIKDIETAGKRASELSHQMLAYSGRGHFTLQMMDLSALITEMAQLLEVSIPKNIQLRFNLGQPLLPVAGDATQLRQVVMNLITNARDAMLGKPGQIFLRSGVIDCDSEYLSSLYPYSTLPSGQYCFLEVSDSGCGMDAATQQRIFEPFFSTKASGHGLGLAAVLGIIRGHQGALKVYSEVGRGTTFRIYIPATRQEIRSQEVVEPSADSWQGTGTILVVDDEPTVRLVADRILRRYGFEVYTADNGRSAVDLYRSMPQGIDLVLLDMTMPQLSGEEACRAILDVNPEAKVILSSGFTRLEAGDVFNNLKLSGFIQKPYRAQDLIAKVRHVLAG